MTHTYQLTGMTCSSCEAKVKSRLLTLADVTAAEVSGKENTATITMNKHIALATLQEAIGGENGKYKISALQHSEAAEQAKSWVTTYKPILLIFFLLTAVSVLVSVKTSSFNGMQAMAVFMAGFFLIFSFFKLLDLEAFAESYAMYDVIAKRFKSWGYIYALVELTFGFGYILVPASAVLNLLALVVMSVSSIGVVSSVLNKRKIQCACLGAVFNLPMSTVTIIENTIMILMSLAMLLNSLILN